MSAGNSTEGPLGGPPHQAAPSSAHEGGELPPQDSAIRFASAALASATFQPVRDESFKGQRAVARGILLSAMLGGVKIISGVFGHSYALIADGIESILDVFTSLVVIGSLRVATSAPSAKHPYGRGKVESLGTLVVGMALWIAAVVMAWQSVQEIYLPSALHLPPAPFTLAVLIVVVVVKEGMFQYLRRVGREAGSGVVESDAWHHRSDALTSAAAFIGISVALIGGKGYQIADDWAALAACVIIAYNGTRLLMRGYIELLDVAPDPETIARARAVVKQVGGVLRVEKVLLRKTGLGWLGELHVEVDGDLTVTAGHAIAHAVKDALLAADLRVIDVAVHVEPCLHAGTYRHADAAAGPIPSPVIGDSN